MTGPTTTGRVVKPAAFASSTSRTRRSLASWNVVSGSDLGHEVVVVRVEPLGHLERRAVALAARDREVAGEVDGAVLVGEVGEALRNRADRDRGVEHLVVVGERLGDRGVGAPEAERREAVARRLRGGEAAIASSSAASMRPAQKASTARLSSRRRPMRG